MPTPSIQTLTTDAQQILNLDSISSVRSVVAVALANANTGTPLNPNLTTQQLWDQFYQVVTRPKSDIESIIANQLMKFLYSPPAPGGAGADKQVIFNDGGVLAGDADFLWNKTTNLLTVTGSATITGDLTVDTSTLKVDSTNNRVGIVNASPSFALDVNGVGSGVSARISSGSGTGFRFDTTRNISGLNRNYLIGCDVLNEGWFSIVPSTALGGGTFTNPIYNASYDGIHAWSDGAGSERMRLNSTGLGIGTSSPATKLHIDTLSAGYGLTLAATSLTGRRFQFGINIDANLAIYDTSAAAVRMIIDGSGNVGIGVTPSAWGLGSSGYRAFEIGAIGNSIFSATNDLNISSNAYYLAGWKYGASSYASQYSQGSGKHIWYTAPSGTAGNAITFTQAMTLDASGNLLVGTTSGLYRGQFVVTSGADRNIFAAQVTGASNGLQVQWDHATTTIRVILANIPTSSAGLASGTLWNDAGTIKIV